MLFGIDSNTENFEGTKVNILLGKKSENILDIGLNFSIKKDWKIYWIYPGDAGLPPELKILGEKKYTSITPSWPYPEEEVDKLSELVSRIYKNNVIIPYKILLSKDYKQTNEIKFELDYQVCKDICIPVKAKFVLDIPRENYENLQNLNKIEKFEKNVPSRLTLDNNINVFAKKISDNRIIIKFNNTEISRPENIVKSGILVNRNLPSLYVNKVNKIDSGYELTLESFEKINLNDDESTIFFKTNESSFFHKTIIKDSKENKAFKEKEIIIIFITAFFAGLILNFMPCVLPVLGIKINNLLKQAETKNRLYVKMSSVYVSLGILSMFICFSIISILLRLIGVNLGWGMQFQSPIFLLFLFFLLLIFTIIAFDLVKFNFLQRVVNNNILNKLSNTNNLFLSNFSTGVLSTLLATPCTAPLVGTAISFALSQSYYLAIPIFILMGLGKAFPYLIFIIKPDLLLHLPKPGIWMKYIKVFIGIMLVISLVWIGKLFVNHYIDLSRYEKLTNSKLAWEDFNKEKLEYYLNANEKVFIDFTAEWCLNCKINKKFVLEDPFIVKIFSEKKIILMRGDWTFPDEEILYYLKKYDRYGIPFNLFFSKEYPRGYLFSEILKKAELIKIISK
ncbi:MAG: protein-disulfide reductase DsbD domain-containing protein [Pseudomonadota bacterium]|nr:protein-disulfide reductase DsbD domain-containing protein [Pseudomonadota bacterium]